MTLLGRACFGSIFPAHRLCSAGMLAWLANGQATRHTYCLALLSVVLRAPRYNFTVCVKGKEQPLEPYIPSEYGSYSMAARRLGFRGERLRYVYSNL